MAYFQNPWSRRKIVQHSRKLRLIQNRCGSLPVLSSKWDGLERLENLLKSSELLANVILKQQNCSLKNRNHPKNQARQLLEYLKCRHRCFLLIMTPLCLLTTSLSIVNLLLREYRAIANVCTANFLSHTVQHKLDLLPSLMDLLYAQCNVNITDCVSFCLFSSQHLKWLFFRSWQRWRNLVQNIGSHFRLPVMKDGIDLCVITREHMLMVD